MSSSLPAYAQPGAPPDLGVPGRIADVVAAAHAVWSTAEERRRMRAFGFRPAVEAGVLKREWHGLAVRVSAACVRTRIIGEGALEYHASQPETLFLDERPLLPGEVESPLVAGVLDLVGSYERWVEAREGRRERIIRLATSRSDDDRRLVNHLAETRRLQRQLHLAPLRRH